VVTLLHHDGKPAADVSLDVICQSDPAPREEVLRRRTDIEGRVELAELFPGKVEIVADRGARFRLEVAAGERREIELRLEEGAVIEGRVVGPRGEPVAGAEIWMEGRRRMTERAHFVGRSAADGSFRIEEVGPIAEIGARAVGFTASNEFEVSTLPFGENGSRRVVLELGPIGFGVVGRVVDPEGRPVAGAHVKIGQRGGGIVDLPSGQRASQPDPVPVATDAEGGFTYAGGFSEGVHPVTVSARGWPIWRGNVEVRAESGGRIEIVLAQPASIDGRVVDACGTPIEGAEVIASEEHWGGWYFDSFPPPRAKTDTEGKFRLGWIAPGQQEVNASAPGRPQLGKAKVFAKCLGGQTTTVQLVLDLGATISGRVVDPDGQPVAGWRVNAEAEHGFNVHPRQSMTDELGRFLVANLDPEHRYTLEADPKDEFSIPSRGELKSVSPGSRDVEIVVDNRRVRDARIRGRLAGEDGRVPGDLQLTFYAEGSDSGLYIDFDPESGAFETEPIFAGRYEVRVYRGGQTVFRTAACSRPGRWDSSSSC
jgi:protocatechuate 3,4-dioxygenase beta subunit